jgi:hypothetical protein
MKKINVFVLEYQDLDNLVRKHMGAKNYECVAAEEWNNDSIHLFQNVVPLTERAAKSSYDREYDVPEVEKFIETKGKSRCSVNNVLSYLCEKKVIDKGNYLIESSW